MNGASVFLRCDTKDVGLILHLLEDMADVFVAGSSVHLGVTVLELRSDRFPSTWHGMEVGALVAEGVIERFVPVVRPGR